MTSGPGVSAESPGRQLVQQDVSSHRISSVIPAMPVESQEEPKQADINPTYLESCVTSAPGAISAEPPGEQERQPADMKSYYRLSSLTIPELPLAPIPEKADDSPKDSTLNEISTPASSPSVPGKLEKLNLEDVAGSILVADQKRENSVEDPHGKPFVSPEKAAEILPQKSDTATHNATTADLQSFQPPHTNADAMGKAVKIPSLTDASHQSGFPSLPSFQLSPTNARPFAEENFQPSRNTFKEDVVDDSSSASIKSRISAGSNSDIQKDDSW